MKTPIISILTGGLLTINAYAVFPFLVDESSLVGTGANTSGTINNQATGEGSSTIFTNTTDATGTLDIPILDRLNTAFTGTEFTYNFDFDVTGSVAGSSGNADIFVSNNNNNDGGANLFDSFQILNLEGVTEFTLTLTSSVLIAGRPESPEASNRPFLAGFGVIDEGSTNDINNFTADIELGGVVSASSPSGTFTEGLPSGAIAGLTTAGVTQLAAGSTSFQGVFNGTVNTNSNADGDYLIIRGFDVNADGTTTDDEFQQVYATSISYTIATTDVGGFSADTAFNISIDGDQFSNVSAAAAAIPEPTGTTLLGLGASLLLLRRRRK